MNQYRVGFNKQVLFHSDEELTDEEIIKEALKRIDRIKGKTTITRGKYKRREYILSKYDKIFFDKLKKSKSGTSARDLFGRYKINVSYYSEVIAGYTQFTKVLDGIFKSERRRVKLGYKKRTDRKYYFCK